MMLAYQPIRSLATLNMAAYQKGAAAFKRLSKIIDNDIKIKRFTRCARSNIEKL